VSLLKETGQSLEESYFGLAYKDLIVESSYRDRTVRIKAWRNETSDLYTDISPVSLKGTREWDLKSRSPSSDSHKMLTVNNVKE
jgi:hypothetical protein